MADFKTAFKLMIAHEGGYVNDQDDPGGETYKGISRKNWPLWLGWHIVDLLKKQPKFPANLEDNDELQSEVEGFYLVNFWNRICGSLVADQGAANSIMDFAVNAGVTPASKLAQRAAKVEDDGVIGKDSITAINSVNAELFLLRFAIAKIRKYVEIVKKRPASLKYLVGWLTRTLEHI